MDVILGKENALPVIEYASLSCGGCAYFAHKILPDIENEFIQTGKIRLIIRPIVMHENDVKASMLMCCHSNPHKLQLAYWKHQAEWAGETDDKALRQIAEKEGMTVSQIDACLSDDWLRQNLVTKKFVAVKNKISTLPTFVIGNEQYPDVQDAEGLRKILRQALTTSATNTQSPALHKVSGLCAPAGVEHVHEH